MWVVAAVSVTLLTFAGSHAAHAQAPQPTGSRVATCVRSPEKRRAPARSRAAAPATAPPRIRRREAVPHRHSALSLRVVPGPTAAVTPGIDIAIAVAFTLAQAIAITLAFALAFAFDVALALVIPVGDALRPTGLSLVAHRYQSAH